MNHSHPLHVFSIRLQQRGAHMKIIFKEPTAPKYLFINAATNRVHLKTPVTGGVTIGTDNTCKAAMALQEFFGKNTNATLQRKSALDELNRYKSALEYDIKVAPKAIREKKEERLQQILQYIETLTHIQNNPQINILDQALPHYPQAFANIMESKESNFYSMLLRPRSIDSSIRSKHHVFTVRREGDQAFYNTLSETFSSINVKKMRSPKDKLREEAESILKSTSTLKETQAALTAKAQALFNITIDFTRDEKGNLIDHKYLQKLFMIEMPCEPAEYLDDLMNACALNVWDTIPTSPFNALTDIIDSTARAERLSILTQFFLGEVNIYCLTNQKISGPQTDFGRVLDTATSFIFDPLNKALARKVKYAIENGQSVETVLFDFINNYHNDFHLKQSLTQEEMTTIKKRFFEHFTTVKDSQHFDDFSLLDLDHEGKFVSHQGSICTDFAEVIAAGFSQHDNDFYRAVRNDSRKMKGVLPHTNDCIKATFEIEDDALAHYLIELASNNATLNDAAALLLADTENGKKVFEVIPAPTKAALITSTHWNKLKALVGASIIDTAVQNAFNNLFLSQLIQMQLTTSMAKALYTAVVTTINAEGKNGYGTTQELTLLLNQLEIAHDSLAPHTHDGFTITVKQDVATTITELFNQFKNKFYLNTEMTANLYREVLDRYGANSTEYLAMQALNNAGWGAPKKLLEALRLLEITVENTSYPFGGINGYIIETNATNLQLIENIQAQRTQYHLAPEAVAKIYEHVTHLKLDSSLETLNNINTPEKIKKALQILGIHFTDIGFHETAGYWVKMSPTSYETIKYIVTANHQKSNANENSSMTQAMLSSPIVVTATMAPEHTFFSRFSNSSNSSNFSNSSNSHLTTTTSTTTMINNHFTVERVAAFKMTALPANASSVQLNCPPTILTAFQNILRDTPILGCTFINPYTNAVETLPTDVTQLTARHLQIIARNQRSNTSGKLNMSLYNNKLIEQKVAALCCLVKATNIAGLVQVNASGGYNAHSAVPFATPQNMIVIDQPGLQWQGDFRNTGGMCFYPADTTSTLLPDNYAEWQSTMFQHMYGKQRPLAPSSDSITVTWRGMQGQLDLSLVAHAIAAEFSQALDAAVSQGNVCVAANQVINFKFLKAGMGYFAAGLQGDTDALQHARLLGILQALRQIAALPAEQRLAMLGKVKRIELPRSYNAAFAHTLSQIAHVVQHDLGLTWGGTPSEDVYTVREGYINACTNCGDPFAMIGNEGGYSSVDAAMATNAELDHLNAAFNNQMQLRASPLSAPTNIASLNGAALTANTTTTTTSIVSTLSDTFTSFFNSNSSSSNSSAINTTPMSVTDTLMALITDKTRNMTRGRWKELCENPLIEVGISKFSGNAALATAAHQIEKQGQQLVVLDKRNGYQAITDVAAKEAILNVLIIQLRLDQPTATASLVRH